MLFKDYHIYPMYLGIKTYTRRFWTRPFARIGGEYKVTHKMYYSPEDVIGTVCVEQVYRQPLGMMTETDAYNEGGYDLKTYLKVLEEITRKSPAQAPVPYVIKFRFSFSDLIDGNGGNAMKVEYFNKWKAHMIRLGLYDSSKQQCLEV